jgi:hypothetical protein
VIVTTNLSFSEWTTMFPNARLCKAMLDRLTDQAHIIETGNESYRVKIPGPSIFYETRSCLQCQELRTAGYVFVCGPHSSRTRRTTAFHGASTRTERKPPFDLLHCKAASLRRQAAV